MRECADFVAEESAYESTSKFKCLLRWWSLYKNYACRSCIDSRSAHLNPYNAYNYQIFASCFVLFVLLLTIKRRFAPRLAGLSLGAVFVMFHNILDYIHMSLKMNRALAISPTLSESSERTMTLDSIGRFLSIESDIIWKYIDVMFGGYLFEDLNFTFLILRFVLFLAFAYATLLVLSSETVIPTYIHLINIACIVCSSYAFHTNVASVLTDLKANCYVYPLFGSFLPVVYIIPLALTRLYGWVANRLKSNSKQTAKGQSSSNGYFSRGGPKTNTNSRFLRYACS